jgi:hypothetical protein
MFSAERIPDGEEFHACGPANEKALSPNLERNLGVVKSEPPRLMLNEGQTDGLYSNPNENPSN